MLVASIVQRWGPSPTTPRPPFDPMLWHSSSWHEEGGSDVVVVLDSDEEADLAMAVAEF